MPSNVLFMDTLFPHITEEDSTEAAIKKILNYDYLLREQLQHTLFNLGAENFNQVEWDNLTQPIYASIGEAESTITELALTSEGSVSYTHLPGEGRAKGSQRQGYAPQLECSSSSQKESGPVL